MTVSRRPLLALTAIDIRPGSVGAFPGLFMQLIFLVVERKFDLT